MHSFVLLKFIHIVIYYKQKVPFACFFVISTKNVFFLLKITCNHLVSFFMNLKIFIYCLLQLKEREVPLNLKSLDSKDYVSYCRKHLWKINIAHFFL